MELIVLHCITYFSFCLISFLLIAIIAARGQSTGSMRVIILIKILFYPCKDAVLIVAKKKKENQKKHKQKCVERENTEKFFVN